MSVEVVIVVVIILFGGLLLVLNQVNLEKELSFNEKQQKAKDENLKIISKFEEKEILKDETIDFSKFKGLSKEEIAEEFNIQGDFCIFLKENGTTTKGVGSSNLKVDGVVCS